MGWWWWWLPSLPIPKKKMFCGKERPDLARRRSQNRRREVSLSLCLSLSPTLPCPAVPVRRFSRDRPSLPLPCLRRPPLRSAGIRRRRRKLLFFFGPEPDGGRNEVAGGPGSPPDAPNKPRKHHRIKRWFGTAKGAARLALLGSAARSKTIRFSNHLSIYFFSSS